MSTVCISSFLFILIVGHAQSQTEQSTLGEVVFSFSSSLILKKEQKVSNFIHEFTLPDNSKQDLLWLRQDLISPNYFATARDGNVAKIIAPSELYHYALYDQQTMRQVGRINVNKDEINGLVWLNQVPFEIVHIGDISKSNDPAYTYRQGEPELNVPLCTVDVPIRRGSYINSSAGSKSLSACYVLEVATDSDYELYQKYGSNPGQTLQHVINQLNIVEGIYQNSGINIIISVVYQNVWTTVNDPYVETNKFAIRDEFRSVWNNEANGFTGIQRDLAYMIYGRLDASSVGGAAIGTSAGIRQNAYAVGQEFVSTNLYDTHLIAHEIGHTLAAGHDNEDPISNGLCISSDRPGSPTMCTWVGGGGFSPDSFNAISGYLSDSSHFFTEPVDLNIIGISPIVNYQNVLATNSINLRIVMESTAYVQAIAGRSINLPVGFHARSGSFFKASINPEMNGCNN